MEDTSASTCPCAGGRTLLGLDVGGGVCHPQPVPIQFHDCNRRGKRMLLNLIVSGLRGGRYVVLEALEPMEQQVCLQGFPFSGAQDCYKVFGKQGLCVRDTRQVRNSSFSGGEEQSSCFRGQRVHSSFSSMKSPALGRGKTSFAQKAIFVLSLTPQIKKGHQ